MKFKKTSTILLIALSLCGTGIPTISANQTKITKQAKGQNNKKIIKNVKSQSNKANHKKDWFKDGLNKKELKARHKVAFFESRYTWNASNGKCFGRYQLLPSYLGYKHGHINLDHKNQVRVADKYVHDRYGSWQKALKFHLVHNWY